MPGAPGRVAPVADLLREPMQLTPAGDTWSVLVPEGRPWQDGAEPVDRLATGLGHGPRRRRSLARPRPVVGHRPAGFTLASGFRRPVGFVWLASGVPAGEDEAMRTFAARMGLDPVLDVQDLDRLTEPDPAADARSRLRGLLAVLARAGVSLPAELAPGEPAGRHREAAARRPDSRPVERPGRPEAGAERDPVDHQTRLGPWMPWTGGPMARALALAQLAAGLPLLVRGLRRRGGGWATAGALLLAHGALGLTYDLTRPRD
ncbi:hypothetical protein SUDANB1_02642 [Streptomyces sp. enrichment culture]